ncbi:unnamed protein product, partial [Symbiodinium sp. CCMP2592]
MAKSEEDEDGYGLVTCRDMGDGDEEAFDFEDDGEDHAWWKEEEEDEWKEELNEEMKYEEQDQSRWNGWYSVKREGNAGYGGWGSGWAKRQKASWSSWQP